jgi:hypothetical protein
MKAPAQIKKSSAGSRVAEGRNSTTRSNAMTEAHFVILVTIGNLVSPASFRFTGELRGRT